MPRRYPVVSTISSLANNWGLQRVFSRMDTNGDGLLRQDEFSAVSKRIAEHGRLSVWGQHDSYVEGLGAYLSALCDTNGDSAISKNEMLRFNQGLLAHEQNWVGGPSANQPVVDDPFFGPEKWIDAMKRADKDKDRQVSVTELRDALEPLFPRSFPDGRNAGHYEPLFGDLWTVSLITLMDQDGDTNVTFKEAADVVYDLFRQPIPDPDPKPPEQPKG